MHVPTVQLNIILFSVPNFMIVFIEKSDYFGPGVLFCLCFDCELLLIYNVHVHIHVQ